MKQAKQDGNDSYLALLEYRNTPWSDTLGSPTQRLMGRRTKQKLYYDRNAKPLKNLDKGDTVVMTTKDGKWKPAKVTKTNQSGPRSYNIVTPLGQQYRRNRKDLRKVTGGTGIGTNLKIALMTKYMTLI